MNTNEEEDFTQRRGGAEEERKVLPRVLAFVTVLLVLGLGKKEEFTTNHTNGREEIYHE
jgi:hypothetical protein